MPSRQNPRFRTCPVCEDTLIAGQGMFACRSCPWTATVIREGRTLQWREVA